MASVARGQEVVVGCRNQQICICMLSLMDLTP